MNLRLARYVDRWGGYAVCYVLWLIGRLLGVLRGVMVVPPLRGTTPPRIGSRPKQPRRVLAIKFYGLGNVALIVPTLTALREAGIAEIDFLTLPGNAELLRRSGLVREVLSVRVGGFADFARSVVALFRRLWSGRYDAVLDFEQFMKLSGIFAFLTRAPVRIGFNTEGQARGWLYSHRVAYADTDHMADIFLRLAAPLGIGAPTHASPLAIDDDDRQRLQSRLAEIGLEAGEPRARLLTLHVGTGPNFDRIALKRWPADRFAALADALIARHGARIVFTGVGAEESVLIDKVLAEMREKSYAKSACDRLGMGELLALIEASEFVVSNDTSVMHLSGLVGTPVVAFFGPTAPRSYGPRGPHDVVFWEGLYCSPCLSNYNLKMSRCVDPVCMRSIEVSAVLARLEAGLLRVGPGSTQPVEAREIGV